MEHILYRILLDLVGLEKNNLLFTNECNYFRILLNKFLKENIMLETIAHEIIMKLLPHLSLSNKTSLIKEALAYIIDQTDQVLSETFSSVTREEIMIVKKGIEKMLGFGPDESTTPAPVVDATPTSQS